MSRTINYIDLFAGAGGLSEGFVRAGFNPIAHVEMDKNACNTLRTRLAYHYLQSLKKGDTYIKYLKGELSRDQLWSVLPESILNSVIHETIEQKTIDSIFKKVDLLATKKKVDVIVGGPPCQAYSLAGRSRDPQKMAADERNRLFYFYADFLKRYSPEYFVFENVTGLLSAGMGYYFEEMISLFESEQVGYKVKYSILKASDYGVLQDRKRVILIGKKGNSDFDYPFPPTVENVWRVKEHLFSDLPALKPGQEIHGAPYKSSTNDYLKTFSIRKDEDLVFQHVTRPHNKQDLEIYSIAIRKWLNEEKSRLRYNELPKHLKTHKNEKAHLDRFKVVNPDGASHTMVAHINKDGHYYIYPDLEQVRSISVREAARIQSFPDNYFFEGGRGAAYKQIGNAVPPVMAWALAKKLKELI